MTKRIFFCIFTLLGLTFSLHSEQYSFLNNGNDAEPDIVIHNRVLAKVNEKPITVLDVVKKMDMVFYKEFPQYVGSNAARFQFYLSSWKRVLHELVDKELILADAEELEMKVENSDVRFELEKMFGPNIVSNLDMAGLTKDEAERLIFDDILLRRMTYLRVNHVVLNQVTPQRIRDAYDDYLNNYVRKDEWKFRVITIRDTSSVNLEKIVSQLQSIIQNENLSIDDIKDRIKKIEGYTVFSSVKISEILEGKEGDLSENYKKELTPLLSRQFSSPKLVTRSSDNTKMIKFFYVDEKVIDEYPSFQEVSGMLKNELLNKFADREGIEYKKKLNKQFSVSTMTEVLSSGFEPFTLEVNGRKLDLKIPE